MMMSHGQPIVSLGAHVVYGALVGAFASAAGRDQSGFDLVEGGGFLVAEHGVLELE
jgi:hypothetical protein